MPWSPIVRRVAGAVYLTLVAFIIAHATNAFVADALYVPLDISPTSGPTPNSIETPDSFLSKQSVEDILQSRLFELPPASQLTKDGKPLPAGPPPPPIEAARKVVLLGTVFRNGDGVLAVLEELTSRQQELYRLGTEVPNVGMLAVIEKDRVLFRSGPSEEWLALAVTQQPQNGSTDLPAFMPPPIKAQVAPVRQTVDRREVVAVLNDPTRVMTHAQAFPNLTDGKLDGFRLWNVLGAGFFYKLGLRNNDVIQRINGVELRDPGMLFSLFQQLRNENSVRVDLVRNSQRQTLTYDIR